MDYLIGALIGFIAFPVITQLFLAAYEHYYSYKFNQKIEKQKKPSG